MGLAVTLRINKNGGTHAAGCRNIRSNAADAETVTIAVYRADPRRHPCRVCGGGVIEPLSAEQAERVQALTELWETRVEEERENALTQWHLQEKIRRADVIDERARHIVDGWDWCLKKERTTADRYPERVMSAAVTCPDCGADAAVTFEPRALRVAFTCPRDAKHGFLWPGPGDEADEPIATWARDGREYVAVGIVAPVLVGGDDTWSQVYGTRADDYRATAEALAAFDAANPEPMQLTPDVRCADCGNKMSLYIPDEPERTGRMAYRASRIEASYSCGIRHQDGKYRRREKADVDAAIDRELRVMLRHHPSWATAPQIEPSAAALAEYADYLTAKIAAYDTHIGAASKDRGLARKRAQWASTLKQVAAMRDQGSFAVAGLSPWSWRYISDREGFTDLARMLLTSRVEVSKGTIRVFTPFDSGTPLYRTLRAREIHEELAELERRQQELADELTELGSAD